MKSATPSIRPRELEPGDVLGRYELLAPIAEGGMAVVWAARLKGSRGFSKTVAVKTILPELSEDAHFERMFLDEARIAAGIRHPNVAEILDLGEDDERLYLVMEWIDGEPLANLRRDAVKLDGIPIGVAVRIVSEACAGLHAAHELMDEHTREPIGLVHRDISPQNILVTFDGVVKVVDFGVAKAAGRSIEKTVAGHVKGKPPYMSPEQASGEEVDRRTDVFALGIVLYQLTTGKHPFRGASDLLTLQNIVSDKPVVPPRAHVRDFPKSLESVVLRAIERDPQRRFPTAREFQESLDEAALELPRTRQEDVARFVQRMAGERGERRRRQIQEAIFLAEEHSNEMAAMSRSGRVKRVSLNDGVDPHGLTATATRVTASDEITQVADSVSWVRASKPRRGVLLLSLVLLFGMVALWFVPGGRSDDTADASAAQTSPTIDAPAEKVAPEVQLALGEESDVQPATSSTTIIGDSSSAPRPEDRLSLEQEVAQGPARSGDTSGAPSAAVEPSATPVSASKPSLKRPGNRKALAAAKDPVSEEEPKAAPTPTQGAFRPPPVTDPGF